MQTPAPSRTDTPSRPSQPLWVLFGVVPAAWLAAFVFAVATGRTLEQIARELNLSGTQSTVVVAAFLVAAIPGLAVGLFVGARGPHAVALPGIGLMVLGLLVTAFAANSAMLTVGRVISGLGAGAVLGAAVALVLRVAPARRVVVAVVAVAGLVVAGVLGRLLGGLLSEVLGFRPALLVALVLGLIVGAAAAVVALARLVQRGARPAPTR